MKQPNTFKAILTFILAVLFGNISTAQCSIDGLDSLYCSDASSVTLAGTPAGGIFSGAGMTDNIFDPAAAGPGDHIITYEYEYSQDNYYLRAQVGEPWGSSSNTDAMDLAFGSGEWILGEFETLDPATVFSASTGFVFIDGSDNGAAELAAFLATNLSLIEDWVEDGGRLLMNSAPNEGGDINFGFGSTTLEYDSPSSSVDVLDVTHPAFLGPNTPTAVTMTGSSYSHAHITGTGFTNVMANSSDATNIVLCEKAWGSGWVMFGGMTTSNFHSPTTEASNWRANLLYYMSKAKSRFYLRSNVGEPWGSTSNTDAMDLAFGAGQWTLGFFEDIDPAEVFSPSTSFIFIDGSDDNASELNTFLMANLETIENWVNEGGSLLLNSAPNEGGDMDFGFDGSTLEYDSPSSSVDVVDVTHPAFIGPNSPTAATMTGSSYSHAHITGTGFTNVLVNSSDATNIVLCEKAWGEGNVMLGGMTTSNYHSPLAEANNWRANLMVYMEGLYDGHLCVATEEVTVLEPITIVSTIGDELTGGDGSIDLTVTGGYPDYTFDWDNDGTGDFDDDEDLTDLVAGTYVLVVEDEWGCTATETIVVNSQVSIVENETVLVSVYPNPTVGDVTVETAGTFNYQLIDMNGKLVQKGIATDKEQLDLSGLQTGVYFIQIQTENATNTVKLIKK